jgi:hypothetical protein
MYSLEIEASRLAEKAVNLIQSSLPWLDDPALTQLRATFTREYSRMLERSTHACLNCGSTNVVEDTVEYPTGVPGERWNESGYVCDTCHSFESSVAVVIPLDEIEMQPPQSPLNSNDSLPIDDEFGFSGWGAEETGGEHADRCSIRPHARRNLIDAAQEGAKQ